MTAPAPTGHRENNFDALRVVAATAVIFGHAFPLNALSAPEFLSNSVQTVGVKIFFVISGYLIYRSWVGDSHLGRFAVRRGLRILPGLALVLALSTFVLGPLLTTSRLPDYFGSRHTWRYLGNVFLKITYDLPGVFDNNPYPIAINGSLWSLPVEVLMYAATPLFAAIGGLARKRGAWLWVVVIALACGSIYFTRLHVPSSPWVFYSMSATSILNVSPYYFAGSLYAYLGWEKHLNLQVALLALLGALLLPVESRAMCEVALLLVLPYVTLCFGLAKPAAFGAVGSRGDFSYGIYLYGFPVQQTVTALWGRAMSPLLNALIATVVTVLCAAMSWHLVEKRAMRLRPFSRSRKPADVLAMKPSAPESGAVGHSGAP